MVRDEVRIEATKLWADAEPGMMLTLQVPDSSIFTFGEGGLCSDYLGSEQVDHCITSPGRSGRVVGSEEYSEIGVGAFSLRLVRHLAKATIKTGVTLAFNILIFPGSPEEIGEISELTRYPSWPGLKIADGELALTPQPSATWGCPVLPLLLTGSAWDEDETHPSFSDLRAAVAAIMATSEPADACRSRKAMTDKWQKYSNNPDDFSPKKSTLTWPKATPRPTTGRSKILDTTHTVNRPV